jgi:hypothetical protein
MEILIESYSPQESKLICESVDNGKTVFLSGQFLSGDIQNRNGRIYPLSEITIAVNTLNGLIKEHGSVPGELGHPTDRILTDLSRCSHIITEINQQGSHGFGKIKIIDTPHGLIVKELIKSGFRPDVSSRGVGNVVNGVVEGFQIQTIDIVEQASGIGCSPRPMFESIEDSKNGRKALTLAEAVKHDDAAQKYFQKEVNRFLDELFSRKK